MIHDSAENVFFDFYFREKSYSNSFPYTVDFDSSSQYCWSTGYIKIIFNTIDCCRSVNDNFSCR